MLFAPTIAGSLPKPGWLAETGKLWPRWMLEGEDLDRAKRDAALIWIKEQEDAGIETVSDGEQFRTHFVHGFLETVRGHRLVAEDAHGHPRQPLFRGRADRHGQAAPKPSRASRRGGLLPVAHAQPAEIYPARPDDDLRHARRRPFRTSRRHGDGVRRNPQRGSAGTRGRRASTRSSSTSRPSTFSWTTSGSGGSRRWSGRRAA